MIYWSVLMAILWTALQGVPSLANLLGGFVVGLLIFWYLRPLYEGTPAIRWRPIPSLLLLGFFIKELVVSSLRVVVTCLRPGAHPTPAILQIPIQLRTDAQIATLANLITLTPGTLTIAVADDHESLFVHSFFGSAEDEPGVRQSISAFERRVMEAVQ